MSPAPRRRSPGQSPAPDGPTPAPAKRPRRKPRPGLPAKTVAQQRPARTDPATGTSRFRVDPPELGAVLRELRVQAGLTQEGLALEAGLGRNHVSEIERGIRNPTFLVLDLWLGALDVSWTAFGAALDAVAAPPSPGTPRGGR